MRLNNSDFLKLKDGGKACILVDSTATTSINPQLQAYLSKFPPERYEGNTTFSRRERAGKLWHAFNDNRLPDAFFPYMLKENPFIVFNSAKVNSTNSVHRIFFKTPLRQFETIAIAISLLSTFSQLSAEIEGRTYGAGVLKHEPSEAGKISILLPSQYSNQEIRKLFWRLHELVAGKKFEDARILADSFALKDYSRRERLQNTEILTEGIHQIRKARSPNGKPI